ncbi:MAG: hypothetical protein ACI4MJ_07920 [Aristaeellaceae bacterium]
MKKKLSVSFVLLVVLVFAMASAALAAGLGLFGQLSSDHHADDRLPELEQVAQSVAVEMATDNHVTLEIGQAYYEGDRVFVSYRLTGTLTRAELHEGEPDQTGIDWDTELEGFICAEEWESDYPEIQKANAWLDGQAPHWAEMQVISIQDGLYLQDGTYLNIIGGDEVIQADGSVIGWKECVIPQEHLAAQMTFKAVLSRSNTIAWQDGTTYRASHTRGENTEIAFTLARNEHYIQLTGSHAAADYQATAVLEQGQVDLTGTITVSCPALWVTQMTSWEKDGSDMILSWNLYQHGQLVSTKGTQSLACANENTLVYHLLYPHLGSVEGLTLVPVYAHSGEHGDEVLTVQSIPVK